MYSNIVCNLNISMFCLVAVYVLIKFNVYGLLTVEVILWRKSCFTITAFSSCWMSVETGLIWAFIGPVAVVIVVSKHFSQLRCITLFF